MKKLERKSLKSINGGWMPSADSGCLGWNTAKRCCVKWDAEHYENPVCPITYP